MAQASSLQATQQAPSQFFWRRLHSLTGIVPVGVFLIEHMVTNSRAFDGGAGVFDAHVKFLHHMPFLFLLELFGIFLPLAFHGGYGLFIAFTGKSNLSSYPYGGNVRYALQRFTGVVAAAFIIVHLCKFRFAHWFGGANYMHADDYFEATRAGLMDWHLPAWVTLTIYVIGLTAAVFHFANGLWTFSITWGLMIGPAAQRKWGYFCAFVGVNLLLMGYASLYGFATAEPRMDPSDETPIVRRGDPHPSGPVQSVEARHAGGAERN